MYIKKTTTSEICIFVVCSQSASLPCYPSLLLKECNMRMILFDKMDSYTFKPTMIMLILYQTMR